MLKLSKWVILTAFLCPGISWSYAGHDSQSAPWNCQLKESLKGDANMYMDSGRNSWSGKGRIWCEKRGQTYAQSVSIRLKTWEPGQGVNALSQVSLKILQIMVDHPLRIFGSYDLAPMIASSSLAAGLPLLAEAIESAPMRFEVLVVPEKGLEFFNGSGYSTLFLEPEAELAYQNP